MYKKITPDQGPTKPHSGQRYVTPSFLDLALLVIVVLPQLGQAKTTPLSSGAKTQLVVESDGGEGPWNFAPLIDIDPVMNTLYKIFTPTTRATLANNKLYKLSYW